MPDAVQNPAVLLIGVPGLLKMLSIGRSRFYESVATGEFGPTPIQVFGRKRLYRVSDVQRWIKLGGPPREKFEKMKGGNG